MQPSRLSYVNLRRAVHDCREPVKIGLEHVAVGTRILVPALGHLFRWRYEKKPKTDRNMVENPTLIVGLCPDEDVCY